MTGQRFESDNDHVPEIEGKSITGKTRYRAKGEHAINASVIKDLIKWVGWSNTVFWAGYWAAQNPSAQNRSVVALSKMLIDFMS